MMICFVTRNHREGGKLYLYGNIVQVDENNNEVKQMLRMNILRMIESNKSGIKVTSPVEVKEETKQEVKRKRGRPKKVKKD